MNRTKKKRPLQNKFTSPSASGTEPTAGKTGAGTCLVVHAFLKRGRAGSRAPHARLEEAVGLARAIHLDVIHSEALGVSGFRSSTLIGSGAVDRLKGLIAGYEIDVVVVDGTLSPIQQRNLERAWKC